MCVGAKYDDVLENAFDKENEKLIVIIADFKRCKAAFDEFRLSFLRSCSRFDNSETIVKRPAPFGTNFIRVCAQNTNIRSSIYYYLGLRGFRYAKN